MRDTGGPGEADLRVTTGIAKGNGVVLEDTDVDRESDDGLMAIGEIKTLDADTTEDSADSGVGSEELVDVESLLEEATGGSSREGDGVLNSVGLTRGVA